MRKFPICSTTKMGRQLIMLHRSEDWECDVPIYIWFDDELLYNAIANHIQSMDAALNISCKTTYMCMVTAYIEQSLMQPNCPYN